MDPFVMKERYEPLLPIAACNLQKEVLDLMKAALAGDIVHGVQFKAELRLYTGTNIEAMMKNQMRKYSISVSYTPYNVVYIAIAPKEIHTHICNWIGSVREICSLARRIPVDPLVVGCYQSIGQKYRCVVGYLQRL